MISKNNMGLYRNVFKLDEEFLQLVGPEKLAFDKRYMLKPPNKYKKPTTQLPTRHTSQLGKKNKELTDES